MRPGGDPANLQPALPPEEWVARTFFLKGVSGLPLKGYYFFFVSLSSAWAQVQAYSGSLHPEHSLRSRWNLS
jgi:hypothetical protein